MDFESFFDEHYGRTVRAVSLAIGDRHRAEDRVQDAFAKAYRKWSTVSGMARPDAWIYVVALNADRKAWTRAERRAARHNEPAVSEALDDHAGSVAERTSLRDALDRLTTRQRATVVLRYLADLPTAEVARVLGCAEGTVKATLHQSLAKLRVALEDAS